MKKIALIIIVLSAFLVKQAFANGGPFNVGTFLKTGNIMLMNYANVKLLSEDLHIKVEGDYTTVRVKYRLKNTGKAKKIWCGFPVDARPDWDFLMNPWQGNDNYIVKYFKAWDNAKPLHFIHFSNDTASGVPPEWIALRRWYVVKINFGKDEVKSLNIEYKVRNNLRDMRLGDRWLPSYSSRSFSYDFKPAGYWADGLVNDFSVTIDLREQMKKKIPFSVKGLEGLKQTDSLYRLKIKNYDLKKAENLNIRYSYAHVKLAKTINKRHIPYNMIRSIKTSSNTENAKYLIDNDPTTVWQGKKGDWIQIDFYKYSNHWTEDPEDVFKLRAVLALNGNFSSKENYNNSGKAKTIKMYFNQGILLQQDYRGEKTTKKLQDIKYPDFKKKDLKGAASIFTDSYGLYEWEGGENDWHTYRNEDGYIWRIKIYVQDIYPAKTNSDKFSISEMYFIW